MYINSLDQQSENMVQLIIAYSRELIKLVNLIEQIVPYAGQPLQHHWNGANMILTAGLSELKTVPDVTPEAIDTLNELLPEESEMNSDEMNEPAFTLAEIVHLLADRVGKYNALLGKVESNSQVLMPLSIQIKHEMDLLNRLTAEVKQSAEYRNLEKLVQVKLLSDVFEHGVEHHAKQGMRPS